MNKFQKYVFFNITQQRNNYITLFIRVSIMVFKT